ncbi:MAG: hypothetical protein JWL61_5420 [Gemmatimonadetes bacterium]|nr:hypothetical protein [Gemmatimonadota bacterium]
MSEELALEETEQQQGDDPLAVLERRHRQQSRRVDASASGTPDPLSILERKLSRSSTIDLADPATPNEITAAARPIHLAPAVVMAQRPEIPRSVRAMGTGPEERAPDAISLHTPLGVPRAVQTMGTGQEDIGQARGAPATDKPAVKRAAYMKSGHPVIDTSTPDAAGHVPTHRLDQPTGREPNESFDDYEARVLAKRSWSPDTASHNDLASLHPQVADSVESLLTHANQDGVRLRVGETKRSQERQEMLFQRGRGGNPGDVVTWTLTSDHSPGRAIDFTGAPAALAWLQQNAPTHGFSVMGAMDPGHVSIPTPASIERTPSLEPRNIPTVRGDVTVVAPNARRAYRPGVAERAGKQVVELAGEAIAHPGQTAAHLITAPFKSAADALLTPEVGDRRPNPNLSKGGNAQHLSQEMIDQPYDAAHGAQPKGGRTIAGLQTLANVAFPGIESAVADRAISAGASKLGGKLTGMAVAGAPAGAAYSPDDPIAGALAGSVVASVLGAAHEGAGKLAPVVRDAAAAVRDASTAARSAAERTRSAVAKRPVDSRLARDSEHRLADAPPTLVDVEQQLASLKEQAPTDAQPEGELTSRINMLEAQRRKLKGEPEPEVSTAGETRAKAAQRTTPEPEPAPVSEPVAAESAPTQAEAVPEYHFRDILDRSPEELQHIAEVEKARDAEIETDLFGDEGAKRYKRLAARENSSTATDEQITAARIELDQMEATLTEAQRRRLFGFGQKGLSAEELGHAAEAASLYRPEKVEHLSDATLLSTVGRELTTGKPHADIVSALHLRGAVNELQRRTGSTLEEIVRRGMEERHRRGELASAAQAGELFRSRMGELQKAGLFTEVPAIADSPKLISPPVETVTMPSAGVQIKRMPVADIIADPQRFQYKHNADAESGAGAELKGLSKFDEQLAGVISVWRDPATGIVHPVNGHNRLALAQRTGHPSINVQELPAKTASEARAMGALANIAEGRGTPLDAAQFFRDSGLGIDDLRDRVSFKGSTAKQGLGLSKLAPDLFAKVARGDIGEGAGAAIGEMLSGHEQQRAAVDAIEQSSKRLSDAEVREVARQVRDAGSEQVTQDNLFGQEAIAVPLYVERAQLASLVKRRLASDRRLFGFVAREGRAEELARGGNAIDVEASRRIAGESGQLEEVFNQLYTRSGPIADALTEAARKVANGENPRALIDDLYPSIRDAVQEVVGRGEGSSNHAPGRTGREWESVPDSETAVGDERLSDSIDPSQDALFDHDPLAKMERDLFGEQVPDAAPQGALFSGREGTSGARSLRETEAAARAELQQLRAEQKLETDANSAQVRTRRIVELEKLVNRGEKISAEELQARASAEPVRDPHSGPDQAALFSPITDLGSVIGAKLRSVIGQPPIAQIARVESLRAISRALADGVGVPLREGRFKAKQRRALGAFFPHAEVARVIRMDRIDTAAHEVAHYISKEYLRNPTMKGAAGRGAPQLSMVAKRELVKMGRDLYGARKPTGGYGEEGIAQWGRFYVTEPNRLATDAPVFTQWVEQHVLSKEPALRQTLDAARQAFHDHTTAPPTARVDAMLSVNDQSALASGLRHVSSPEARSWLARKLITYGLDDLGEFKRAVAELGGARSPTQDAYVLARLTRGAAGMAEEMLDRGIVDPRTNQRVAPAVHDVLASLKPEELAPFRRYLVAERAIELADRGVDAGIAMTDALEMRRMYEPQFRARAEQLWQVSNALIDYRVHKGLLTDAEGAAIKAANQRRVGFYRVFEDEEGVGGKGNGKGFGRNSSGIQRAVGSSREIIDPLESVITDVYKTVAQSHAHEAALALYKHALRTEGGGRIAELVPAPQAPVEIPVERVKQQLEDLGFIVPNGGLTPLLGMLKSFQDATTAGARETKDLVVPVILNGERKWLAIKDAQLYDALAGLNQQQLPMWLRIAGAPTRLLRAGATLTGEFIARNPVRDAFTAAVYSQGPNRPPGFLAAEGLFHLVKRDDLFQRWRLAGGDNAAQLGLDRAATQKNLAALTRSTHGKIADVVVHPIDALRMISGIMENATRIGEFSAVARKAGKAGMSRADTDAAAGFASRDVTVDFAKAGQVGRAANQLMSFFNATVQGNLKLITELRARPAVVLPRIAAMITIPSIALYLLQRDDPAYQEVPQWQKDVAWIVIQRDEHGTLEHIWRIPKPPELGILFGSTFERALQFIDHHDPRALDGLTSSLGSTLNPFHMPEVIRPAVEWWANKSFFRDRPIVPSGMEKLPAAEQSTRYTGEAARVVGRLTNTSPAKIENTVSTAAGGLGVYAMQGADAVVRLGRKVTGGAPIAGAEAHSGDATTRMPVVRGFAVRQPGGDAESVARTIKDFHEAEGHRLAWQRKLAAGDATGAAEYLAAHRPEILSVATHEENAGDPGRLRAVYDQITLLQKQSAEVSNQVRDPVRASVIQRSLADRQVKIARQYRLAAQIRQKAPTASVRAAIPRR